MSQRQVEEIYFIEDSSDEIFLTEMLLANERVDLGLCHVASLEEFWRHLETKPSPLPEIVLVDLNLPHIKGSKIIEELLKSHFNPHLIVGICTGSDDPKDRQDCLNAGAHFFVGKPLDLECLAKICAHIESLSLKIEDDGSISLYREMMTL